MANSDENIQILELIRLNGNLEKLIAASRDDNVLVKYNNVEITLTAFIEVLLSELNNRPTLAESTSLISQAINNLIGSAPETLDTLKEIADAIIANENIIELLSSAIDNKVDKEEGKGLSSNDFSEYYKARLNQAITVVETTWNPVSGYPPTTQLVYEAIQNLSVMATALQNGLMSKEDKIKLDSLPSFVIAQEAPDNMNNGDIFIQIVGD